MREADKIGLSKDQLVEAQQQELASSNSDQPNTTRLTEDDYLKEEQNQFSQLLGLPKITLESIYKQNRESDPNILNLMREHSNFITVYEGYPEFLTMLTHKSIVDKNRLFKVSPWSQETGVLDFYCTLDIVNRYHAMTKQM